MRRSSYAYMPGEIDMLKCTNTFVKNTKLYKQFNEEELY